MRREGAGTALRDRRKGLGGVGWGSRKVGRIQGKGKRARRGTRARGGGLVRDWRFSEVTGVRGRFRRAAQ